jgi:hypothetical protein
MLPDTTSASWLRIGDIFRLSDCCLIERHFAEADFATKSVLSNVVEYYSCGSPVSRERQWSLPVRELPLSMGFGRRNGRTSVREMCRTLEFASNSEQIAAFGVSA